MPFALSGTARGGKSGIVRNPATDAAGANSPGNVVSNMLAPLDPRKPKVLQGSVTYVALEVAVSKLLRMVMGGDNKSYMELAAVHTISLGLMGGVSAAFSTPNSNTIPYSLRRSMAHIQQGAKGIPALFIAQYVYNTFFSGFRFSFFSLKDALIMSAAKILTRPIAAVLAQRIKFVQNGLEGQQLLEEMQNDRSNFARISQPQRYDPSA